MSENTPAYGDDDVVPTTIEAFKNHSSSRPFNDALFRLPNPAEIKALREIMGWNTRKTARLLGINYTVEKGSPTLRRWQTEVDKKEHRSIPYAAWRLMLICAGVISINEVLRSMDDVQ